MTYYRVHVEFLKRMNKKNIARLFGMAGPMLSFTFRKRYADIVYDNIKHVTRAVELSHKNPNILTNYHQLSKEEYLTQKIQSKAVIVEKKERRHRHKSKKSKRQWQRKSSSSSSSSEQSLSPSSFESSSSSFRSRQIEKAAKKEEVKIEQFPENKSTRPIQSTQYQQSPPVMQPMFYFSPFVPPNPFIRYYQSSTSEVGDSKRPEKSIPKQSTLKEKKKVQSQRKGNSDQWKYLLDIQAEQANEEQPHSSQSSSFRAGIEQPKNVSSSSELNFVYSTSNQKKRLRKMCIESESPNKNDSSVGKQQK